MARSFKPLPLFTRESPTPPQAPPLPRRRPKQLWFAVAIPESAEGALHGKLAELAAWAYELTPLVSLEPPDGLLLEVQGSLKLFGGFAALKQRLAAETDRRRIRCKLCAAPTPSAALWLVRHAQADVLAAHALAGRLGALPLAVTRWPDGVLTLLAEMGLRTIGDCLRLPRDGFARRVGAQYLAQLDKALGKLADPRLEFRVPPRLGETIELSGERTATAAFAVALEKLVTRIAAELRRRQCQVQNLRIVFRHARQPATVSLLQLVEPAHELPRLLDPLIARLERLVMPAPVVAISVYADDLVAMRIEEALLFAGGERSGKAQASAAALVERLRGRFGLESVYGLGLASEHRPERAWIKITERLLRGANEAACLPPVRVRPLWILPAPLPLVGAADLSDATAASREGAVQPERIESGWWDDGDVKRDYYAVTTARGQRLWAYQDRDSSHWYLHGLFG
jgi:protein ImuB